MKKHIDYKVPNGKLIRLEIDLDGNIIKSIKITGDFFIHPESKIEEIENELKNIKLENVEAVVRKKIESEEIKLIGFGPKDLANAIENLIENKKT